MKRGPSLVPPSVDWSVSVDGDLCMEGESITDPFQFAPNSASHAEGVANINLASAAPAMKDALSRIIAWCAGGDLPEELTVLALAALSQSSTGINTYPSSGEALKVRS